MPKNENIEWEIKDGKCECRILEKCEISVEKAFKFDAQALGEWFGSEMEERIKEAGAEYNMLGNEREMGSSFKKLQHDDIRALYQEIDRLVAKYGNKNISIKLGDLKDVARDVLCQAAIDYINHYKDEFEDLR